MTIEKDKIEKLKESYELKVRIFDLMREGWNKRAKLNEKGREKIEKLSRKGDEEANKGLRELLKDKGGKAKKEAENLLREDNDALSYFAKFKDDKGEADFIDYSLRDQVYEQLSGEGDLLPAGNFMFKTLEENSANSIEDLWKLKNYKPSVENRVLEDLEKIRRDIEQQEYLKQQKEYLEMQKREIKERKEHDKTIKSFTFVLALGVIATSIYYLFQSISGFVEIQILSQEIYSLVSFFIFLLITFLIMDVIKKELNEITKKPYIQVLSWTILIFLSVLLICVILELSLLLIIGVFVVGVFLIIKYLEVKKMIDEQNKKIKENENQTNTKQMAGS